MYLSHNDNFGDVDPNAISFKYSMYTFANARDNGDPIPSPPSCRYMSNPILILFVSAPKLTPPSGYLFGYWCVLPLMDPRLT